jgi:broad specificity phosphatase PhoE
MSLIIYFLRHGETTASRNGGYCGALDPDLTPEEVNHEFHDAYVRYFEEISKDAIIKKVKENL